MRTPRECLTKALEMEALAESDGRPSLRAAWLAMAAEWRTLAGRAVCQDHAALLWEPSL